MNISIVEEKKNRLVFALPEENQTLPNILRSALWEDEDVKNAGYHVTHPLVGHPVFVLETKTKDPRKVIDSAIKGLVKDFEKLSGEAKTVLK